MLTLAALLLLSAQPAAEIPAAPVDLPAQEGWVTRNNVMLWYLSVGKGTPLLVLHGGPGNSHDYLMPWLVPLARTNRLVFIDERGSGRSTRLEDPSRYTIENMADDVEAVREALELGKISLLGHSYGGALAQAYALKYQDNLSHLILSSTFSSTKALNEVLAKIKAAMPPAERKKLDALEKAGLFGKGEKWERGRYSDEYEKLAWGVGYFPYLYRQHPDPAFDPTQGPPEWNLYRQMWGSHGEFVVDGNLTSVEYLDKLKTIRVPTLVTVGDHDQVDPALAKATAAAIPGAKLVVLPDSGHLCFVDQPELYVKTVAEFVNAK